MSAAVCECCENRPAVGRVVLPGDEDALLCGGCLDDARALGLVGPVPVAAGGVR